MANTVTSNTAVIVKTERRRAEGWDMKVLLGDADDVSASADALGTRPTWCLLTDPAVMSTVPPVASGLKGFLRARGVAHCEIDDYIH